MFYYNDFFFEKGLCSYLISWFEESWDKLPIEYKKIHRKTECIMMNKLIANPDNIPNIFKKIYSDINYHGRKFNDKSYVNHIDFVKWPTGEKQNTHKDLPIYSSTSIIYLNDNFTGGETRVGDMNIKPKTGKIVSFTGQEYDHEVYEITKGNRYTLAVWYGTDDTSNINSQSESYKSAVQDQMINFMNMKDKKWVS